MILLTLGTDHHPFERALDLVLPLGDEKSVLVQHGHTPPRLNARGTRWLPFVGYLELVELMRAASSIVCHGGVGTIVTALEVGRAPVVIPRLRRFGEHVDDHQLQIAADYAARGHVVICEQAGALRSALAAARRLRRPPSRLSGELKRAVIEATRADHPATQKS